jgi:predicted porin
MKHMRKSLIGMVGLAVSGLALADDSTVTIYGTLIPFFENVETSGATTSAPVGGASQVPGAAYTGINDSARNRLTVGTTNIGFRGTEDLGNGLKAIFQVESGVPIDGTAGPNTFASRNSNVGLAGGFGTVFLGQWDTPYKSTTLSMNPFRAGYVFDYTPILGNPGFAVPATTTQGGRTGAKPDAAFDRRQGNSVQYWTPNLGGFTGRIAYSANEGKTTATATVPSINPDVWSGAVAFDTGPLTLRYAYEQHNDYFGMAQIGGTPGGTATNTSSKDFAHKVVAAYTIGATGTRIAGAVERLEYKSDDAVIGAINEYRKNTFYLVVEQKIAGNSIWGTYGKAQDGSCSRVGGAACNTSNLGAQEWSIGYIHRLSKRSELFAVYYAIDNEASGTYATQPTVGAAIAPGADTHGFGVGMIHYF